MPDHEVPVLIVGGSLVGLTTAMLLGHHGVRSLTVEHHHGTSIYPRAAQMSQRTMEILRTVGLERQARQKSEEQFVQDGAVMAVETLAGKELAWYVPNLIWSDLSSLFRGRGFGFWFHGIASCSRRSRPSRCQLAGTARSRQGRAVVWRGEVNP